MNPRHGILESADHEFHSEIVRDNCIQLAQKHGRCRVPKYMKLCNIQNRVRVRALRGECMSLHVHTPHISTHAIFAFLQLAVQEHLAADVLGT